MKVPDKGGVAMYKNLRAFRESLKMTQEEFGKSVGVAKTTYNNYETGKREPDSEFWIKIAEKYGVSIDYLMGYKNEPYKQKEKPSNSTEAEPEGTEKWLIDLLVKGGYLPFKQGVRGSNPRWVTIYEKPASCGFFIFPRVYADL